MKKKNQKIKTILVFLSVFVLLSVVFYFGVMQSVLGWSQYLSDFSNKFDLQGTNAETSLAYLKVPKNTNEFSFTIFYHFSVRKSQSLDGKANILYEVFNHETQNFETIHNKQWVLPYSSLGDTDFRIRGISVYGNGIPQRITQNTISLGTYERTYGCLDGMTIEQAKQLNPPSEGTSTYVYKCAYPDESLRLHDYNDKDWGDIYYFPNLVTLDSKYILEDKVTFRITASRSGGLDTLSYSDFDVELWDIKTEFSTYYRFENEECNEIQLMTYQTTPNDYLTEKECRKANNLKPEIPWDIIIPLLVSVIIITSFIFFFLKRRKH